MRFVLVHGGFHAAWCWESTVAELNRLGHEAVAVDLPGHGARVDEESTLANRTEAITTVMEPGDVLVGHSGGGFDMTLAADAAPDLVSHLIYLAAPLPREGRTYPEAMAMRERIARYFAREPGQLGTRPENEVERIERYHAEPDTRDPGTPLFAERSLFRD